MKFDSTDIRFVALLALYLLPCGSAPAQTNAEIDVSGLSPIQAAAVRVLDVSRSQVRPIDPINYMIGRMTLDDAYGVQDRICTLAQDKIAGYKLAFASRDAQKRWHIDGPVSGRLLMGGQVAPGGSVDVSRFRKLLLEAEVAFTVAADIKERMGSIADIRAKTASVHVALDIVDLPYSLDNTHPTVEDIVCANAAASHFAIGKAVSPDDAGDLAALRITLKHDNEVVYDGTGSSVMDTPWNAYLWLANHLLERGVSLQKGDVVLSGAVTAAYEGGTEGVTGEYIAEAGALGSLQIAVK